MPRSSDLVTRKSRRPAHGRPATVVQAPMITSGDSVWFNAPMGASEYLLRFVEQVRRSEMEALREMERDVDVEMAEALSATTPSEVLSLQVELAAVELARLAQMAEQLCVGLLDAQSRWMTDVEACAAHLARPWLGEDQRITVSAAEAVLDPSLDDITPLGLMRATHKAWSEMTKAWLDAIMHDLQAKSAAH